MTKGSKEQEDAHIGAMIDSLMLRDRRGRARALARKDSQHRQLLDKMFTHRHPFREKFVITFAPDEQDEESILATLKKLGAGPECYVLSEDRNLNGRIIALEEALSDVVGFNMVTVVSCIPGELIYYEGEDMKGRFVVSSRAKS